MFEDRYIRQQNKLGVYGFVEFVSKENIMYVFNASVDWEANEGYLEENVLRVVARWMKFNGMNPKLIRGFYGEWRIYNG